MNSNTPFPNIGQDQIIGSDFFFVLLTKNFFNEQIPPLQLEYAISIGKPIIIFKTKDMEVPMERFENANIIVIRDYERDNDQSMEDALNKVMEDLRGFEDVQSP